MNKNFPRKIAHICLFLILAATVVAAQQTRGALRGAITDDLGAVIVGANVTLTDASGAQKKTTTNGEGVYNFAGLAPGKYTLQAVAPGFAPSESREVDITGARQTLDL
ncbi:MAG TPA: carboxypeptidase-like regulatory domain-containing protein, partial [Pyrinomonadaceae bacterium]|nr:carboxypeptidase-like regulatory domain-containing protein [Pyrinomonadaceae bacterium]